MAMARTCVKNGTRFVTENSYHMGTRGEKEKRSIEGDMEENSRERGVRRGFESWREAKDRRLRDLIKGPTLQSAVRTYEEEQEEQEKEEEQEEEEEEEEEEEKEEEEKDEEEEEEDEEEEEED